MSRACTARRRPPSRACCSPPGAVSEGLRGFDPLGLGQSSRGWRGGRLGKGVLAEGPEPGAVREGSCGEPGAAWGWAGPPSLPPRLPASPARRAHLRRPEPCRPTAPGKVVVPGARRAQRCSGWDSGREGRPRPWTGEVTFPAPEPRLPGATSQTSDPFFLLLVCVPPARGSSGRCLFGSGSSIPSRDGCCGPGREDEFTAVEQVALEMECQSLSFIAWVSCGGKWAFPSYQPSLLPVYWVRTTAFWDNLGNSGAGAVVFAGHPGSGAVGHTSPVSTRECF